MIKTRPDRPVYTQLEKEYFEKMWIKLTDKIKEKIKNSDQKKEIIDDKS